MKPTLYLYRLASCPTLERAWWIYRDETRAILGDFDAVVYLARAIPDYDSRIDMAQYVRVNGERVA